MPTPLIAANIGKTNKIFPWNVLKMRTDNTPTNCAVCTRFNDNGFIDRLPVHPIVSVVVVTKKRSALENAM